MTFQVIKKQQPTTGGLNGTIYRLENVESGDCIEVWPALGFNCIHWEASTGDEASVDILYADPALFADGRPTRSGIPILFPFPNRIAEGRFTWEGNQYLLPLNDSTKKNAAHGFVCRRPWRVVDQGAEEDQAWITGEFELAKDDPESSQHWPANFVLRVTYRVSSRRLRVEAEVTNPDRVALPFGLGYHPYFRLPLSGEDKDQCQVQVPAQSFWELDESIPTGVLNPVDEMRDLRQLRAFRDLSVDDVLTGIQSEGAEAPEGLRWNGSIHDGTTNVRVFSSPVFRELVVFTPPHRNAFCIEPYTCPTNAINLAAQGMDVGWLRLEPEQKWNSVVELVI